jgi:autotransporter-associated beta strand protein
MNAVGTNVLVYFVDRDEPLLTKIKFFYTYIARQRSYEFRSRRLLVLSGTDSYGGGTTVSGGELETSSRGALPTASLIVGNGSSCTPGGVGATSYQSAAAGTVLSVPEPSTGILLVAAFLGRFILVRRRHRKKV